MTTEKKFGPSDGEQRRPRAQTVSFDRIKLVKSATQTSIKSQSVYEAQKRYPKSLYNKSRQTNEFLKMKPYEVVGGVFYTPNNESSYIYPTQTLFSSSSNGIDAGRRRDSLRDGNTPEPVDKDADSGTIRPFTFLHRLPTALYRNDEQTVKIKVKRKKTNMAIYDSASETESPDPCVMVTGGEIEPDGDSFEINKVEPLKDARKQTSHSNESDLNREPSLSYSDEFDEEEIDDGGGGGDDEEQELEDQTSIVLVNDMPVIKPPVDTINLNDEANKKQRSVSSGNNPRETPASAINVPLVRMELPKDDDDEEKKKNDEKKNKDENKIEIEEIKEDDFKTKNNEPAFVILTEKEINNVRNEPINKSSINKVAKNAPKRMDSESTHTLISNPSTNSSSSPNSGRMNSKKQRKLIEENLIKKYPFQFAIIYCEILLIFSLLKFALQIVLLVHRSPYNYLYCGFWSAFVGLVITGFVFYTAFKRRYHLYKLSQMLIILGIGVFVASAIINSICLRAYKTSNSSQYNSSMLYANLVLMIAEVISFVFSLVFILDNLYEVEFLMS